MKPDQHKKKRSAQYKRKHGIAQKKDADKPTKTGVSQTSKTSSSANVNANVVTNVSAKATCTRPAESQITSSQIALNKDSSQDESEEVKRFSRRKIQSNWERYEPLDDDRDDSLSYDGLKGADFKALLSQTGDASSQFRFKDEQLWDNEDSDVGKEQGPEGFPGIDCHELSERLMAIPLPVRLNIDGSFFEPSELKHFDEIASRHKEKLDAAPGMKIWGSGNQSEPSLMFTVNTQVLDVNINEITEDNGIFPDSEDEEEANTCTERTQLKEQHTIESAIGLSEDVDEQASALGGTAEHQDVAHDVVQRATKILVTEDTLPSTSCESQHLEDMNDVTDSEENVLDAKTSCREDHMGSHLHEKTSDLASNQQKIQTSDARTTAPVFSKTAVISTPLQKNSPPKHPHLEPKAADTEDDELDFLLSLENPLQTRSKPDISGQYEELSSGADWQGNSPSQPEGVDMKTKPVQTPSKIASSTQNGSDNLEDWLDSVLGD